MRTGLFAAHRPLALLVLIATFALVLAAAVAWGADKGAIVRFIEPRDRQHVTGDPRIVVEYQSRSGAPIEQLRFYVDQRYAGRLILDNPEMRGIKRFRWYISERPVSDGWHELMVEAYDTAGFRGEARIMVQTGPVLVPEKPEEIGHYVTIEHPVEGQRITAPTRIEVQVHGGPARWVMVLMDGKLLAHTTSAPYVVVLDPSYYRPGLHKIQAIAKVDGAEVESALVTVYIEDIRGGAWTEVTPTVEPAPAEEPTGPVLAEPPALTSGATLSEAGAAAYLARAEIAEAWRTSTPTAAPEKAPPRAAPAAPRVAPKPPTAAPEVSGAGPAPALAAAPATVSAGPKVTAAPRAKPEGRPAAAPVVAAPAPTGLGRVVGRFSGPGISRPSAKRAPATPVPPRLVAAAPAVESAAPAAAEWTPLGEVRSPGIKRAPTPQAAPVGPSVSPAVRPVENLVPRARVSGPQIAARPTPAPAKAEPEVAAARTVAAVPPTIGRIASPGIKRAPAAKQGIIARIRQAAGTLRFNRSLARVHVVRPGETLSGIARRYGVSMKRIGLANGISENERLRAGRRLLIPPETTVLFDDVPVAFDVAPMILRGTAVAPIRHMLEHAGGVVYWRPREKLVEAVVGGKTVSVQVGSCVARVDEERVLLDIAAFIKQGRVMVPVRFVGEVLDVTVRYDPVTQNVHIVSNAAK